MMRRWAFGVLLALAASSATASETRIVSLAPHLTELAFAAGLEARLVGVVEWSNYPAAARDLPRIGDAFRFDAERILALDTTHALVWVGGTPPAAVEQIETLGIAVIRVETRTLDQIGLALEELSGWAEDPTIGLDAAHAYREQLEQLRAASTDATPLTVFYQISARPLFTLGGRHVMNEVLALCSAANVFADLDQEALSVGVEAVLDRRPDLFLVGLESGEAAASIETDALDRLNPALKAVGCSATLGVEAETLVRPTPRILEAATHLCTRLDRLRSMAQQPCPSRAE